MHLHCNIKAINIAKSSLYALNYPKIPRTNPHRDGANGKGFILMGRSSAVRVRSRQWHPTVCTTYSRSVSIQWSSSARSFELQTENLTKKKNSILFSISERLKLRLTHPLILNERLKLRFDWMNDWDFTWLNSTQIIWKS